jgi:hypothetical protein
MEPETIFEATAIFVIRVGQTKRQLDTLAFEQERTLQLLCLEAIDLLFQAHGRPRTAVEGAADAPAALPKSGR